MKQRHKKIEPAIIQNIKLRLDRGSYIKIATDLNISYGHVSDVMNGHKYNPKVIFRAIELVKEQEDEVKEKLAEINL